MNIHEHFGCMSRSINDLSTSSYEFCKIKKVKDVTFELIMTLESLKGGLLSADGSGKASDQAAYICMPVCAFVNYTVSIRNA